MKLTAEVTEQDILNGTPGDSATCPIALAFKRFTQFHLCDVEVDGEEVRIGFSGDEGFLHLVGELPESAKNFVLSYDEVLAPLMSSGKSIPRSERIKPFSFSVELHEPEDSSEDNYEGDW